MRPLNFIGRWREAPQHFGYLTRVDAQLPAHANSPRMLGIRTGLEQIVEARGDAVDRSGFACQARGKNQLAAHRQKDVARVRASHVGAEID